MPASAALASLAVLVAISGCFNVRYGNCRITCNSNQDCPSSLTCVVDDGVGLCAPEGTTTCADDTPDAGPPDAPDAATPDAADGPDGDAGVTPPEVLCHAGSCLPLPEAVRANLVLLLWPSNLPAAGAPVPVWSDQSGKHNDARALYDDAPPHVVADGVQLDASRYGTGLYVANSPSLDFGTGDFAVIVVAGLVANDEQVALFTKADGARGNQRQVTLDWKLATPTSGRPRAFVNDTEVVGAQDTTQPSIGVYAVERVVDHVELRLNGTVLASGDLPPGSSTTNSASVYLGTGSLEGYIADTIEAVVVVRGHTDGTDLAGVESFLRTLFAQPR